MPTMTCSRILVVKLADLGDVLLTEPAIRSLRKAHPDAAIDVLTTPVAAPLVNMLDPGLGVVRFEKHLFDRPRNLVTPANAGRLLKLAARLRAARYDAVGVFHHLTTPAGAHKFRALAAATAAPVVAGLDNGRGEFMTHPVPDLGFGSRHVVDYMLEVARQLGGADVDARPRLSLAGDADVPSREFLDQRPYAVLFPVTGPFAPGRNWPASSFARLASDLAADGLIPVIAGGADARQAATMIRQTVASAIDLSGQTTLDELVQLVRQATVVVSGDSFPGHLAAALDTPVVSIFGPSNHQAWAPYGARPLDDDELGTACIIRKDVPCSPCLYTGFRLGRRCGCSHRICLTGIHPAEVHSAVTAVIGKHR